MELLVELEAHRDLHVIIIWHHTLGRTRRICEPAAPQVLPFASEETLRVLEENLASLPAITDLLHMGMSARQLTGAILGGLGTQQEVTTSLTPRFGPCDVADLRHRM